MTPRRPPAYSGGVKDPRTEPTGGGFYAHARPGVLSLLRPDGGFAWLDAEGRPLMRGRGPEALRRALDGRVLLPRGGGWEAAGTGAAEVFVDGVRRDAADALAAAADGRLVVAGPDEGGEAAAARALRYLRRAAEATPDGLAAHAARYAGVQGRVSIVPPAWYRALYARVAPGCPWNRCAFCGLYAGVEARRLDAAALATYLEDLAGLLGEAADGLVGVFLGDAHPLLGPLDDVVSSLRRIRAAFPRAGAGGFGAFEDSFLGAPADAARYARLRGEGLVEVTIGLESGAPDVLAALGKPLDVDALVARARAARAGGVGVALTVLVGASGTRLAEAHRRATAAAVEACGLGPADVVYLSPLALDAEGRLSARFRAAGLELPEADALAAEETALRAALRAATPARIIPYRVDRFVG